MKKALVIIFVFAIVLSLCACGAQSPSSSAPQPPAETGQSAPSSAAQSPAAPQGKLIEPAQLVSKSDAEKLTGAPFDDVTTKENAVVGQKLLQYTTKDAGNYMQVGLTQQAFIKTKGVTVQSIYDGIKEAFPDAKKAAGVGDDAFFAPPGLHIMYHGYYINIALTKAVQDKLVTVGKFACESLDKLLK